jgi:hypothetical protein
MAVSHITPDHNNKGLQANHLPLRAEAPPHAQPAIAGSKRLPGRWGLTAWDQRMGTMTTRT